MRAMNIAATGMQAQQINVETISNNIANMNTTAYNRRRAEFSDLLYQSQRRVGAYSSDNNTVVPAGIQLGLGVKTAAIYRITEQGSLENTNNSLDLAVQGRGYFKIQLPSGDTAYTRAGDFQLSSDGTIVTQEGYTLLPATKVDISATAITVNASGQIIETLDGSTGPTQKTLSQLQISVFPNENGLEAQGGDLYMQTAASGENQDAVPGSTGYGTILQGYLESSNVNTVTEITNMISAQRAYEMNSKVIKTCDDMMSTLTQMK